MRGADEGWSCIRPLVDPSPRCQSITTQTQTMGLGSVPNYSYISRTRHLLRLQILAGNHTSPTMPAHKTSRATSRGGGAPRPGRGAVTCNTCTPCRQKKVKCDGARPKCHDCAANGLDCVYPRDARRELRASKTRIQSLEDTLAAVLAHMRESGIVVPGGLAIGDVEAHQGQDTPPPDNSPSGSLSAVAGSMPLLPVCSTANPSLPNRINLTPVSNPAEPARQENEHEAPGMARSNVILSGADTEPIMVAGYAEVESARGGYEEEGAAGISDSDSMSNALSPCEARVAGVFHEHGCVSSVHGLAGIMNPTSRERHKENLSKLTRTGQAAIAESKARLISNAALQK